MGNSTAILRAFERHGFGARYFDTPESLQEAFMAEMRQAGSIAFGGSATLRQLGLDRLVQESGIPFHDHWQPGLSVAEVRERRLSQGRAELFVTGANAATLQGQLFLVDGIGNRVAACAYGPARVLFVLGENKLVVDLDAAWRRVREIAAPRRAAELNLDLPCVKTGRCNECNSPARICRNTLIIERPNMGLPTAVWFVRGQWGL